MKQDPGHGPKRIGTPLTLSENLYGLLYISTLRQSIKDDAQANFDKRQTAIDLVIQNQLNPAINNPPEVAPTNEVAAIPDNA
jgi:hypothetical protein